MSEKFWLIVWPFISLAIACVMNFLTHAPILDLTAAHIFIAGLMGLLVTAICFVVVESILFITRLLSSSRRIA